VGQSRNIKNIQTLKIVRKSQRPRPLFPQSPFLTGWTKTLGRAFLEMRRRKRAPVTDRATDLLIRKLDGWRHKGHDPTMILDASTASAWTNLYEPKDEQNGRISGKNHSATDQHLAGIAEIIRGRRA